MNLKLAAFWSDRFCHISGPPGGRLLPLVMAGGLPSAAIAFISSNAAVRKYGIISAS